MVLAQDPPWVPCHPCLLLVLVTLAPFLLVLGLQWVLVGLEVREDPVVLAVLQQWQRIPCVS